MTGKRYEPGKLDSGSTDAPVYTERYHCEIVELWIIADSPDDPGRPLRREASADLGRQSLGVPGTEAGQFQRPRDLAFAPDGSLLRR